MLIEIDLACHKQNNTNNMIIINDILHKSAWIFASENYPRNMPKWL